MGISLMPRDDQSEFEVHVITPEGYTLDRTDKVLSEIEARLWKLPGTVPRLHHRRQHEPQRARDKETSPQARSTSA